MVSDSPDYQPNDVIFTDKGRFLVTEPRLGRGGVADVYLAEDSSLRKKFVLKVMRRAFWDREDLKRRFIREARILAKLEKSVYFIKVQRVGWTLDGMPYFIMDHIHGESLRDTLDQEYEKGRLPKPKWALNIGIDILSGLYDAHTAGVIHRDIKPENIFLDEPNQIAKILDFGAMKLCKISHHLSTGNGFIGTPLYASPEQFKNPRDVDEKCDIFAAGLVIFEILTGTHAYAPHRDASAKEIIDAIKRGSPRRLKEFGSFPPALDRLIYSMVRPDRRRRASDAHHLARALRDIYREHYSSARRQSVFSSDNANSSKEQSETISSPITEADLMSLSLAPLRRRDDSPEARARLENATVNLRPKPPRAHTELEDDPLREQKETTRLLEELTKATEPSPIPPFYSDDLSMVPVGGTVIAGRFGRHRSMLAVAAIALLVAGASLALLKGRIQFGSPHAEAQPKAATAP